MFRLPDRLETATSWDAAAPTISQTVLGERRRQPERVWVGVAFVRPESVDRHWPPTPGAGERAVDEGIRQEIEKLRGSQMKELKQRYRQLFGEESPSSNRMHLFRRVAWRLQARAAGDLSEQARQRAGQLAADADLRLRAPRRFWGMLSEQQREHARRRDPRLPPVGTELTRIYRGQTIVVRVEEDGFRYQQQSFASLSAIAYQVTGTRWNGYLFFRLQAGQQHE
jgi:hypothetical protein